MDGHFHIHTTLQVVLSTVVFRRDLVQVLAGLLVVLSEYFMVFLSFFRQMPGQHLEIGHDRIFLNSYLLTTHDYLSISFDTIHAVETVSS